MLPVALSRLLNFIIPKQTLLQGSQRPVSTLSFTTQRNYDLEITETPVRDYRRAREYIELLEHCYEARHCLSSAADDSFGSSDGDDQGWTIADTLDDNETKIHPDTKALALDLIGRKQSHEEFVIGSDRLKKALRWALGYGDCFLSLGFERDGKSYTVARTLYLPTWEMFRCESNLGILEGFEQRRTLSLAASPDYQFLPCQVVHFRYEPKFLYGDSIFSQSLDAWGKLKNATEDLAEATRALGQNPNLHIMAEGCTPEQRAVYRQTYEAQLDDGIVTDFYLWHSQDLRKMAQINPDLKPLVDSVLQWRYRIIPPGFPVWFFPGLDTTGAREISGQPAKKYARMRNSWCGLMSKGIRQIIDTEIILQRGLDWWHQNGKYRIIFPKWSVSETGMENEDESNKTGINDLD